MADSGSLRVRRHRRHARGDHSLCLPGRCDEAAEALDAAMGELSEAEAIELGDRDLVAWLTVDAGREASPPSRVDRLRLRREGRHV
jgi:hypothetical protein